MRLKICVQFTVNFNINNRSRQDNYNKLHCSLFQQVGLGYIYWKKCSVILRYLEDALTVVFIPRSVHKVFN